nr:hypothetical protein [Tanacetum cinerariifolium]
MAKGLRGRMLMEHMDAQGQSVLTSRAWRRLFDIRGPLVYELILEFFSTFRDPMLRLCHRLIACSIVRRSQAPEKVIVTDLFYPRRMDVGSVNVPYLLTRYLRFFASGRKHGEMISGDLPIIDMAKLVRLQICVKLDDTWAWVASRPERQPDATDSTLEATKDAPVADEGALVVIAPMQAPQPSPPAARPAQTMAQRLARVEEDVYEIQGALGKQGEILDSMACVFSRFFTWMVVGLSQMMSQAGVRSKTGSKFSTIAR